MAREKKSFFERITGTVNVGDEEEFVPARESISHRNMLAPEEPVDAELTVDVYETPDKIVIKTLVAGVKPDDLDVNITRDSVSIRGRRETHSEVKEEHFYHKELYWGTFSRVVSLPQEVQPEHAEALVQHGLLIITIPKVDRGRQTKLKIKSA